MLPRLDYVFDEGVYIQQARRVLAGQLPYRDFFGHQTPLYTFALAAFTSLSSDSLSAHRLLSVLATALCGLAVYSLASARARPGAALAGTLLFLTTPLQYFDLVAMPNAVMLASSSAAFGLVCFGGTRAAVSAGAMLFAVALLLKPIAISTALAAGLTLAGLRRWADLGLATLVGAGALAVAWGVLDASSGGAFTDVLRLQTTRHAGGGGFELMRGYESIAGPLEGRGIESAVGWNLVNHARTFLPLAAGNRTFPLTLLGACGLWLAWRLRPGTTPEVHESRLALTLWLVVPLGFSIFVWDPAFQYYFVQYLPPLAILGAIALDWLWQRASPRLWARVLIAAGLAASVGGGAAQIHARQSDYTALARPRQAGEHWLLFDPFLNFVSETEPGCDLIDPFNVYGETSLASLGSGALRARFLVDAEQLIRCLEVMPETRIGLGYWSTWFVEPPLSDYLATLPDARFVPMRLHYKGAGSTTPPAPERLRHGLPHRSSEAAAAANRPPP